MKRKAGTKKLKVGVLMGGWSPERKISLVTGRKSAEGLKKAGFRVVVLDLTASDRSEKKLAVKLKKAKLDAAFIALHGGYGEDGGIQSLLERLRIPYTGSGPLACGLAMQKACAKLVMEANQVPTAPWQALEREAKAGNRGKEVELKLPVVVKPADGGSAIGVTIVRKMEQLNAALKLAFRYSPWALVEQFIEGKEVTVGVLGERALPVIEILPKNEFYDLDAKYTPGKSIHLIPARISRALTKRTQEISKKAGKVLGCEDFYRVDLIVPKRGDPQVLEVNTVPGMTGTSLFPEAAAKAGISFPQLLSRLVWLAVKKHKTKGRA